MRFALFLVVSATCGIVGCAGPSSPAGTGESWSRERFEHADYGTVFEAGRTALSQWFPLAETRIDTGMITTQSVESDERGGTGRIRDEAVNYRNRIRRTATLRIQPPSRGQTGPTLFVAECQVRKQRLDTADLRTFAQQRSANEAPTDTPIQREAGASADQTQVWTDVGRDRAMERRILDVMRRRVPSAPSSAPSGG